MALRIPEQHRLTADKAKRWAFLSKEMLNTISEAFDPNGGYFMLPPMGKDIGGYFLCRLTNVEGWTMVAATIPANAAVPNKATPTWEEQNWIKKFFFEEDDVVAMFHPGPQVYLGNSTGWVHLWQPQNLSNEDLLKVIPPIFEPANFGFHEAGFATRLVRGVKDGLKNTFKKDGK